MDPGSPIREMKIAGKTGRRKVLILVPESFYRLPVFPAKNKKPIHYRNPDRRSGHRVPE